MHIFVNFLATYLIFIFPLLGAYYFFLKKDNFLVFKLIFALLVERIFEFLIKLIYFTPRPYMVNHLPTYVTFPPLDSSFPSGHTMIGFALSTVIFMRNKTLGIVLYVISLTIGVARIFANVHYPIDIISGLIVGVTIGLLCDKIIGYVRFNNNPSSRRKKRK